MKVELVVHTAGLLKLAVQTDSMMLTVGSKDGDSVWLLRRNDELRTSSGLDDGRHAVGYGKEPSFRSSLVAGLSEMLEEFEADLDEDTEPMGHNWAVTQCILDCLKFEDYKDAFYLVLDTETGGIEHSEKKLPEELSNKLRGVEKEPDFVAATTPKKKSEAN
jgi:hypothetical protein